MINERLVLFKFTTVFGVSNRLGTIRIVLSETKLKQLRDNKGERQALTGFSLRGSSRLDKVEEGKLVFDGF